MLLAWDKLSDIKQLQPLNNIKKQPPEGTGEQSKTGQKQKEA